MPSEPTDEQKWEYVLKVETEMLRLWTLLDEINNSFHESVPTFALLAVIENAMDQYKDVFDIKDDVLVWKEEL